jgi:hypothetical protein
LRNTVEKADIIDHYGTPTMPMQLGMMAEFVYGRGVMGQDGTSVRRMLMMRGGIRMNTPTGFNISPCYPSTFDMSYTGMGGAYYERGNFRCITS